MAKYDRDLSDELKWIVSPESFFERIYLAYLIIIRKAGAVVKLKSNEFFNDICWSKDGE